MVRGRQGANHEDIAVLHRPFRLDPRATPRPAVVGCQAPKLWC